LNSAVVKRTERRLFRCRFSLLRRGFFGSSGVSIQPPFTGAYNNRRFRGHAPDGSSRLLVGSKGEAPWSSSGGKTPVEVQERSVLLVGPWGAKAPGQVPRRNGLGLGSTGARRPLGRVEGRSPRRSMGWNPSSRGMQRGNEVAPLPSQHREPVRSVGGQPAHGLQYAILRIGAPSLKDSTPVADETLMGPMMTGVCRSRPTILTLHDSRLTWVNARRDNP